MKLVRITTKYFITIIFPITGLLIFIIDSMPKIRTLRTRKAPKGFEEVEPVLD